MIIERSDNIFISHSSVNKDIVEQFCAFLIKLGIKSENIFCSSIIGQGVNNGEKLNNAIAEAIKESSLIIYLISRDFLESSYCMEELGVGWYLSVQKKTTSYYLILPDIDLSELTGFVNSKIDKFSFIDEEHRYDLGLLAENICEYMELELPRHSMLLNAENTFYSAVCSFLKDLKNAKALIIEKDKKCQQEIIELNKTIEKQEKEISLLKKERQSLKEEQSIEKKTIELQTIARRFDYLGFGNGITIAQYKTFSKDFWFGMLRRYYQLEKETGNQCFDYDMELLAATIYSANGDYKEAYQHFVNYIRECNTSVYSNVFENVRIEESNNMEELVDVLKNRIKHEPEGLCRDSYKELLEQVYRILKERGESHA